ncbi:ABC transporter permease [Salipaludibacillus sp. CF4.18]|uniref:ABC transporter permease n=1 Tax=Salipaludibacillus sp. CF4.18 TaxID=3373081 RepID=UPI003EE7DBC8
MGQVNEATNNDNENKNSRKKEIMMHIFKKYGILIILILLIILMTLLTPHFLTSTNLLNIVRQMSIIGIIAIGVTPIIITRGIDLSSGSMIALISVIVAMTAQSGMPIIFPILAGLGAGLFVGILNGLMVAKAMLPPFIATLGMMTSARGLALLISEGRPIGGISESFRFIGQGVVVGIPVPIIIFALIGAITWVILNKTKLGKYIYAIGGNEQAAVTAGINVAKVKLFVYSYAGLLGGLAGVILTSRIASGQPQSGLMFELDAIASAVIGGTSLFGGIGTVGGTIIGALIIGVMNNGLDLLGVSSYWQQITKGAIIVVAVYIDSRKHQKKK